MLFGSGTVVDSPRGVCSWRGGLLGEELLVDAEPMDAAEGPVPADCRTGSPVLESPAEVAALCRARSPDATVADLGLLGATQLLVARRAGGVHATVPAGDQGIAGTFATLAGLAGSRRTLDEAYAVLEEAGVVRRTGRGAVQPLPVTHRVGAAQVLELRDACTRAVAGEADVAALLERVGALGRETLAYGNGRLRWRQAGETCRLVLHRAPRASADACPRTFGVCPSALPEMPLADGLEHSFRLLPSERGDFPGPGLDPIDGTVQSEPLLVTAFEVGALVSGGRATPRDVPGILKVLVLWRVLADAGAHRTGPVEATVKALAGELRLRLGYAPGSDIRAQTRSMLGRLRKAGLVTLRTGGCRPQVVLNRPALPAPETVGAWCETARRWADAQPDDGHVLQQQSREAGEALRHEVRRAWIGLLETRRVVVRVVPAPVPCPRDGRASDAR